MSETGDSSLRRNSYLSWNVGEDEKVKLNKDGKNVLRSFEHGQWKSVESPEAEKQKAVEAARATLSEDSR